MIGLVNDLLDVSRIETGKKFDIVKRPINIALVIKEILGENIALVNCRKMRCHMVSKNCRSAGKHIDINFNNFTDHSFDVS